MNYPQVLDSKLGAVKSSLNHALISLLTRGILLDFLVVGLQANGAPGSGEAISGTYQCLKDSYQVTEMEDADSLN